MMLHPSVDDLMEQQNIDSKYTLVVAAAKRARQLQEESKDKEKEEGEQPEKYVRMALEEIANAKTKILKPAEQHLAKK